MLELFLHFLAYLMEFAFIVDKYFIGLVLMRVIYFVSLEKRNIYITKIMLDIYTVQWYSLLLCRVGESEIYAEDDPNGFRL